MVALDRTWVHIGTHKTGTSALQRYMRKNLLEFHDRGMRFYAPGAHTTPAYHALPLVAVRSELTLPIRRRAPDWTLAECLDAAAEVVRDFQDAEPGTDTFFSHEGLSLIRQQSEAEALAGLLGEGHEVHIIAVVRDPAEYLNSWRAQLEKMDLSGSSPFRSSYMYTESDSWLTDYAAMLAPFEAVFGSSNVHVVDYNRELEASGSIIPAVLRCAGWERLPAGWRERANVTGADPQSASRWSRIRGMYRSARTAATR